MLSIKVHNLARKNLGRGLVNHNVQAGVAASTGLGVDTSMGPASIFTLLIRKSDRNSFRGSGV